MVSEPMKWVKPLSKAGASSLTFHIESTIPNNDPKSLISAIREENMKVGMVVKPDTSVDVLLEYVPLLDMVLIMTVNPGFSGQKFMGGMMSKVKFLRENFPELDIQVDGGLSPDTIDEASKAGANVIVAASAIFGSNDKKGVIDALRQSVVTCGNGN